MTNAEKLKIIETVLLDVASREACYPDGSIAEEIILKFRELSGDQNFCPAI